MYIYINILINPLNNLYFIFSFSILIKKIVKIEELATTSTPLKISDNCFQIHQSNNFINSLMVQRSSARSDESQKGTR